MATYRLDSESLIEAPVNVVFEFFSRAENLEKLTPAFLRFQIVTPLPIDMKPGAEIAYRLRLFGVPFRWISEITVWQPGVRFIDVQRKGPYRRWEHEHRFQAEGDRTRVADTVWYEVPGGPLAPLIHAIFVRKRVRQIFAFREIAIQREFPRTLPSGPDERAVPGR